MDKTDELLSTPIPEFDAATALARFHDRVARERTSPASLRVDLLTGLTRLMARPWSRAVAAAAGAIVVVFALTATGVADTFFTIFEPQRIAPIEVSESALAGIPDPSQYGTLTWIAKPAWHPAADAAAAAAEAGFTPLVPTSLPATIPSTAHFAVMPPAKATFRFDATKAAAAAAKVGATLPPMPAAVADTTLTLSGGPAIVERFGGASKDAPEAALLRDSGLILVQAKAPVVTSDGASVDELRDYALQQPGVPPGLAAQIRAIGDPVRTLMVPVGMDTQRAHAVTVRGTQGYAASDETGLGTGVFWLEHGNVMAAFGSLNESELLQVVNGLR
jgi:hypothetical protein